MVHSTRCPECDAQLPTGTTAGLCPKCLMGAALESSDQAPPPGSDSDLFAPTPMVSHAFEPPLPATLAPHFPQLEILELIGQGGMGAVYKARQIKLGRLVALKIIRPESAANASFAERFNREARTLAHLNHPHIVGIHDFGEINAPAPTVGNSNPQPLFYFLMEYVDGANLRELLQAGELQPAQSLAIVSQLCDALQFAHDAGVIHRDIKPENILIDTRGRAKIADFGLAKLANSDGGQAPALTLTGTHQVMGTPLYMAPEQMEGSHAVDHRADIYSLGVVFYEMLTGELPLGRFDAPSRKCSIDARLDDIVLHALEKDPQRRYQQVDEVASQIQIFSTTAAAQGGNVNSSWTRQPAEHQLSQMSSLSSATHGTWPGPSTIIDRGVAALVGNLRGNPSPRTNQHASAHAHYSLKAILGACWAALFFVMLVFLAIVPFAVQTVARESSRSLSQSTNENASNAATPDTVTFVPSTAAMGFGIVFMAVGLFAACAPLGTTILGLVAVSEIRHANGRLLGLGLALADCLLFPLLLLNAAIIGGGVLFWDGNPPFPPLAILLVSTPIFLQLNFWLVRLAWRKAVPPSSDRSSVDTASSIERTFERISSSAKSGSKQTGGRDWVTLTRQQVEQDQLPDICIVCGKPAHDRVNKTFQHEPDWVGWLLLAGVVPALIASAIVAKELRVACPVCPRHRQHWSRPVWLASTGWLLLFLFAGIGYSLAWLVAREHGAVQGISAGVGAVIGLLVWLIPMIWMFCNRVDAEWITGEAIRFKRVSATFAKAAGSFSDSTASNHDG